MAKRLHGDPMRLSKSRLLSYLQCPKRLWLEINRRELAVITPAMQARFDTGHRVGEIARKLYDDGHGVYIEHTQNLSAALKQTQALLSTSSGISPLLGGQASLALEGGGEAPLLLPRAEEHCPQTLSREDAGEGGGEGPSGVTVIFEATFEHEGVLVRTDVLERTPILTRLIEVKAATEVKEEYATDCAIQTWVLTGAGVRPDEVVLAHVNNKFTYRGGGNYRGLLTENSLGDAATIVARQVPEWSREAKQVLAGDEPTTPIGTRCRKPYECSFIDYCWPKTHFPLTDLPRLGKKLDDYVARGYKDVRDVPESEVSGEDARRVWSATIANRVEVRPELREELREIPYPRYYLDFETIAFAVPIWAGTRPYQAIPYQWSVHIEASASSIAHFEYLDLSGDLPVEGVARSLIEALGNEGPILSYGNYELQCIKTLATLVPELADRLHALEPRLVDLLPIIKRNYYHPAMHGSWSIKAVLPTVVPEMRYEDLGEVQEGDAAQRAYLEAISPTTSPPRKSEIAQSLRQYCAFDTQAMLRMVQVFEARS